ncbi:unnamed protein product [Heligmosomoides polygyrus]|uniref:Uncharacterized protein n=1 Tax=Heligmosomoides polygyrus TaxID=6339 RepID=A0A183FVB2_HELPZ|nr:unnamed protein product [Heligmosomoides polygyrus]
MDDVGRGGGIGRGKGRERRKRMKRGTRPRANSTPGDSPGVVDSAAVAVRLRRLVVLSVKVTLPSSERINAEQIAATAVFPAAAAEAAGAISRGGWELSEGIGDSEWLKAQKTKSLTVEDSGGRQPAVRPNCSNETPMDTLAALGDQRRTLAILLTGLDDGDDDYTASSADFVLIG